MIVNGSPIYEDQSYNVQLIVIVRGDGLWGDNYGFYRIVDGAFVQYASLGGSWDALEYFITMSGDYAIVANGEVIRRISVSNLQPPDVAMSNIGAGLKKDTKRNTVGAINVMNTTEWVLNYPYKVDDVYRWFYLQFNHSQGSIVSQSRFGFYGCIARAYSETQSSNFWILEPNDPNGVCYVTLDDFIIWVGNYEQQRRRRR